MNRIVLMAAALAFSTPFVVAQTTQSPEVHKEIRIVAMNGGSFLGVEVDEVTAKTAPGLGLNDEFGALIVKVLDSTGAKEAGLQPNDVVIGWNGTRVESSRALRRMVAETPVGRSVRLTIVRNGATVDVSARIGERKDLFDIPDMPEIPGIERWEELVPNCDSILREFKTEHHAEAGPRIGVMVTNSDAIVDGDAPTQSKGGAFISSVIDGMPATAAGLQPGDVITSVDGKTVSNAGDLRKLILEAGSDPSVTSVLVGYRRGDAESTVKVDLDRSAAPSSHERRMFRFRATPQENEPAPTAPPSPRPEGPRLSINPMHPPAPVTADGPAPRTI